MISCQKTNVLKNTCTCKIRIYFSKVFKPFAVFKVTHLKMRSKETLSMVKQLEGKASPIPFCQVLLSTKITAGRSIPGIMANLYHLKAAYILLVCIS